MTIKKEMTLKQIKVISYLALAIVCVCLIGTTFAWYFITKKSDNVLTFGQIELDKSEQITMSDIIGHAIAGDAIVNTEVSIRKAVDSKPMYIRAKLSFKLSSQLPEAERNDVTLNNYLKIIREHTQFNIVTTSQHGAVWTAKEGNYVYLVNQGTTKDMFKVDNNEKYVLTNKVTLPLNELKQIEADLKDADGNVIGTSILQYGKFVVFTISFEAIQSDYVEYNFMAIKNYFNSVYPEEADEKIV